MTDWRDEAVCASGDEDLPDFFSKDKDEQARAVAVCHTCPVRKLCLESALDNSTVDGTWGGATEGELRRVQSLNPMGDPFVYANKTIRCPHCGPWTTRFLKVVARKRARTHIQCTNCGIQWWTRKIIGKTLNF